MSDWPVPTFADVLAARRRIAAHLRPTPLFRYPALDELLGTQVHVKHENHQPVGAFKLRGGVNLVAQLSTHPLRARCKLPSLPSRRRTEDAGRRADTRRRSPA